MFSVPPATTMLGVARLDGLRRHHRGLETGAADLVHGGGGDRVREAGLEGGLARGVHAETRLQDAPEDDLVHLIGTDAAAAHRFAHGDRAQLDRGDVLEHAAEGADGGTAAGKDDDVGRIHDSNLPVYPAFTSRSNAACTSAGTSWRADQPFSAYTVSRCRSPSMMWMTSSRLMSGQG